MNVRRRFHATMSYGQPDRVPLWEDGLRDDVLHRWQQHDLSTDKDLGALFQYDSRERIELNLDPSLQQSDGLCDEKTLHARCRNVELDSHLPPDWPDRVKRWQRRDHVLELPIHRGLFRTMDIACWAELEPLIYLLADRPGFIRGIMDEYATFAAALADRVLRDIEVDFVSFSEPIGSNHAPILSPALYKEVVLDSYAPVLDVLQRHGVRWIVFTTYANARLLLRDVVDAGFNVLWAMETESRAMDYRDIRREFGRALRLIGGIDLDLLLTDESAIRNEIMTKVPPILADGGYIPLADGRVRSGVPFKNYACYRRLLEKLAAS